MSWLQQLYETYETCYGREPDGSSRLMPIAHTTQQAHVEIVLDGQGNFRRAMVVEKERSTTLIPCTEASGGRAGSKPTNHPLCDKLQYVAGDYLEHGGEVTSGFVPDPTEPHRTYLAMLSAWSASEHGHSKLKAILKYVERGRIIDDLLTSHVLPADESGRLLKQWSGDREQVPAIYKVLSAGQTPEDAFVRWSVEDDAISAGTWEDQALINSWVAYYAQTQTLRGYCMVQGQEVMLAEQHPAKLRNAGDKAKLISANDGSGFTYRGRFTEADQAISIGYDVTQKAHNALRWLIARQGSRNGDQAIVSWAISGVDVPDPMADSYALLSESSEVHGDISAGEAFALQLKQAINGYQSKLTLGEGIYVMALDSATPGRMSITFYRELHGSEFLKRIEDWHMSFSWPQDFGKYLKFLGTPSPRDIAKAAYGQRIDSRLDKATCERLLPCIVEGSALPRDLFESTRQRVVNRVGLDPWEWEKCLGIACSLFKGLHKERNYKMALEPDRTSRDYLYGRLLALAESIESYALYLAGENRETTAARLMQRFSDRPFSTWRNIELALTPYKARLRNLRPAVLDRRQQEIDAIHTAFKADEFIRDTPLTGEFLLAYHCQRAALRPNGSDAGNSEAAAE
ncbi:MAG: type I-C CRISPR-associated protein Cas8c/Csd1 [Pseudomonadota bacterium]